MGHWGLRTGDVGGCKLGRRNWGHWANAGSKSGQLVIFYHDDAEKTIK